MFAAVLFSFTIGVFLIYPVPIGAAINTRSLAYPHFVVPCFIYFSVIFFYDECRRVLVRRGITRNPKTGKIRLTGWLAQNNLW